MNLFSRALFNLSEPIDQIRFRQYNAKAKYPTDPIEVSLAIAY